MEYGLVIQWLVTLLALGAVALPLAALLLPERSHGPLAFPLALATLTIVGHLVGQVAFGWVAVGAGLVVLVGGSLAATRRVDPDLRSFGEGAVVFVAGFLLIVGLRALDPAAAPLPVAVGEKFLDFGILRSLARSPTLPPEDVWFAGEPIRYYYGGHLTTALLATLTGTATRFAYNLGLATFYATLVAAAYGVAASIATHHGVSPRLSGALSAVFVGLAGNLETAARVAVWLLPAGLARWLATQLGLPASVVEWTPAAFSYWDASRVVPVDPRVADPFLAATEFPLFAWLNGDHHAHMLSQPYMLLAAALLYAYWRRPAHDRTRRRLLLVGVLPPVAGLIGFVNLWSFPTVGGLTVLTVAFAPADPADLLPAAVTERLPPARGWLGTELRRGVMGLAVAAVVLLLGIVWTAPYWLGGLPGSSDASLALWSAWTPLGPLLLVHGAFLAAFVPYVSRRVAPRLDRPWVVALAVVAVLLGAVLIGFPALGLVGPLLVGVWWLLRRRYDVGFEAVLILGGLGLVLIVEMVTVEGERFNTIFKPYVHIWLLWASAMGVVLVRLANGAAAQAPDVAARIDREGLQRRGAVLGLAIVVTTGLYAGLALPAHVEAGSAVADRQGPTLDARAFVDVHFPQEAPAIAWLDTHAGQPTIVTAAPGGYFWRPDEGRGASAPATLTGLPTVLGWFHERQYRGPEPYTRRLRHVTTIYEGEPGRQSALLARYDVAYVYVGPAERARYDLTIADHPALEPAFPADGNGSVVVYRVDQNQL